MVPVGELPPESVAESVRVTEFVPSVTVVGLGVVVRVGLAVLMGAVRSDVPLNWRSRLSPPKTRPKTLALLTVTWPFGFRKMP